MGSGSALYGGEAETQLAHALQSVTLAEDAGCIAAVITADRARIANRLLGLLLRPKQLT